MLGHARLADEAGLDVVSVSDHPYFAERLDAYAALGFVLGATSNVTGAVIMTNLLSRPAPILARTDHGTVNDLWRSCRSRIGCGRDVRRKSLALGVPRLSPAARIRALEEAIMVVRALSERRRSGHVRWRVLPGHRAGRPRPHQRHRSGSARSARRTWPSPADTQTDGFPDTWPTGAARRWPSHGPSSTKRPLRLAGTPLMSTPSTTCRGASSGIRYHETRDDEGRWIGGGVTQWVEELTFAVLEHAAAAFIYLVPPGDSIGDMTLNLWASEVVPAVREAIAGR